MSDSKALMRLVDWESVKKVINDIHRVISRLRSHMVAGRTHESDVRYRDTNAKAGSIGEGSQRYVCFRYNLYRALEDWGIRWYKMLPNLVAAIDLV